jgi:hypothetical protein
MVSEERRAAGCTGFGGVTGSIIFLLGSDAEEQGDIIPSWPAQSQDCQAEARASDSGIRWRRWCRHWIRCGEVSYAFLLVCGGVGSVILKFSLLCRTGIASVGFVGCA